MADQKIIEYVRIWRQKKSQRVGVFVAFEKEGKVVVGWSKCRVTGDKRDKFDKSLGLIIAEGRTAALTDKAEKRHLMTTVPVSMADQYDHFLDRCSRHFKVPIYEIKAY